MKNMKRESKKGNLKQKKKQNVNEGATRFKPDRK